MISSGGAEGSPVYTTLPGVAEMLYVCQTLSDTAARWIGHLVRPKTKGQYAEGCNPSRVKENSDRKAVTNLIKGFPFSMVTVISGRQGSEYSTLIYSR